MLTLSVGEQLGTAAAAGLALRLFDLSGQLSLQSHGLQATGIVTPVEDIAPFTA